MGRSRRIRKSSHPSSSRPWPTAPPPGGPRRRLPSLGDGPMDCPTCGPVERLRSGWSWDDEDDLLGSPVTLYCVVCGEAVAVLG